MRKTAELREEVDGVEILAVEDLSPMVKSVVWKDLLPSLQEGLVNPIVVVRVSAEEWFSMKERVNYILDPPAPTGSFLQIRCGNNRVDALKYLGYTHVPVLVAKTVEESVAICREHELWHKQRYGRL